MKHLSAEFVRKSGRTIIALPPVGTLASNNRMLPIRNAPHIGGVVAQSTREETREVELVLRANQFES